MLIKNSSFLLSFSVVFEQLCASVCNTYSNAMNQNYQYRRRSVNMLINGERPSSD